MLKLAAIAIVIFLLSVPVNAEVIVVPAGGNLQAAVDAAKPGDEVVAQAGATYAPITLPAKNGAVDITIRSSRSNELPEGVRVTPSQSSLMARIQTPHVDPALKTATGASHYKFIGIEFTVSVANTFSIIRLEAPTQTSLDQVPHHITFDRCLVMGNPALNVQAGITMNAAHVSVLNSWIDEIHWVGVQSYGLGAFNGPGPFDIRNNMIKAAGLNIIFGGSTPAIRDLVASDISIVGNHLLKPLEWKGKWTTVNLLELKSARRWVIADNLMENNWPDAQVGWAVIFNTFRDGGWEVIEDGLFTRNTIRNSTNGINLRGMDSDMVLRMRRIKITDNLLEGLGFGGQEAKPFQLLAASEDVEFSHNSVTNSTHSLTLDSAGPGHLRLKFNDNLIPHGSYGVFSNGGKLGSDAMNERATDWQMEKNALVAPPPDLVSSITPKYAGNYLPRTAQEAVGLLGTDGQPVGRRVAAGPTPTPVPSPTVEPSPLPTPAPSPTVQPTPEPTPLPQCTIEAPASVVVPRNGSGQVSVTLSGLTKAEPVAVIGSSGQVTVTPLSRIATGTSNVLAFQLRVKRQSRPITFQSACGNRDVMVNVP